MREFNFVLPPLFEGDIWTEISNIPMIKIAPEGEIGIGTSQAEAARVHLITLCELGGFTLCDLSGYTLCDLTYTLE